MEGRRGPKARKVRSRQEEGGPGVSEAYSSAGRAGLAGLAGGAALGAGRVVGVDEGLHGCGC